MNNADNIRLLRKLDQLAQQANALWNQVERTKMQTAKYLGVSKAEMDSQGIYTDDEDVPREIHRDK